MERIYKQHYGKQENYGERISKDFKFQISNAKVRILEIIEI